MRHQDDKLSMTSQCMYEHVSGCMNINEPQHEISNNWYVRPSKPQISLRICTAVADPGPLMLGVLDRWALTVNILQTLIAQISFHIELCPIEARDSISLHITPLSIWPSGFRDCFHFYFVKKRKCPRRVINLDPRCVVGLKYRKQ